MKKTTTQMAGMLTAAIVMTATGLHAQSATTTRDERSITVTGCLQPAASERSAVGTSGSTAGAARSGSSTSDTPSFMLVNARVGSAPGGGSGVATVAPAGSGTTESAVRAGSMPPSPAISGATDKNGNSTAAGAMYVLRGDHPELPRHAGQEVEISGRLIAAASTPGAATTPAASASAPSTSSNTSANTSADRLPQLEVRTIRMIASACASR